MRNGSAGAAPWANRTEQGDPSATVVAQRPRAGALGHPRPGQRALPAQAASMSQASTGLPGWPLQGLRTRPAHRLRRGSPSVRGIALVRILLAQLSGHGWRCHEAGEGGRAGPFAWRACEPVADAAQVHGSGREHVLPVGFGQADGARPAQVHGAGAQ